MFLLIPGMQTTAIGWMIAAMTYIFVWPSLIPNGTLLGLNWSQWALIDFMLAL